MPAVIIGADTERHDRYMLERRFRSEDDGSYLWTLYEHVSTGLMLKPASELSESDKAAVADARAHPHGNVCLPTSSVQTPGVHPHHKQPTHFEFVWMPVFTGSEMQARAKLAALLGGGK